MTAFVPTPLKYLSSERITSGVGLPAEHNDPTWPRYIRTTDIAGPVTLRQDIFYSQPPELLRSAGVQRDDLLLTNAGMSIGKSYLHASDQAAVYAGYLTRVRPNPRKVEPRFLAYFAQSKPYWQQIDVGATRSTIDNFSSGKYQDVVVPVPALHVQRQVADYLDTETARIDTLIAKNEHAAELLEERLTSEVVIAITGTTRPIDPGVLGSGFWLAGVPEHWTVAPLGARYRIELGKMLNAERADAADARPYLGNSNVRWDDFAIDDLKSMAFTDSEWARYGVERGDLLVCEGGDIGRAAVWDGKVEGVHFQKALHRLRAIHPSREVPRFQMYALMAGAKTGVFAIGSNKATIDHLTGEKLAEHRFPFPPVAEQQTIVRELDEAMRATDQLRAALGGQHSLLRERRQALITAAVTGEIEV